MNSIGFAFEPAKVLYVIDGDTIKVEYQGNKESIRLIGIDTPESKKNKKALKDAKRSNQDITNIVALGKQSSAYTKSLVKTGSIINLEFDLQPKDKYDRLLCYVYLANGKMLNDVLIRAGYASPMTIPPNIKYQDKFVESYNFARSNHYGLWK